MTNKVFAFMEQHHMLEKDDWIVAGVSGGADSVCLLLLLLEYRKKIPFQLAAVHVNHQIRKEAKEDAAYVEKLCGSLDIPFFLYEKPVARISAKEKLSLEEAGRKVRYEAFRETLKVWKPENGKRGKIAVAHHLQDNAETLLFHLFRGTGIWGLAGIHPVRGQIIRPMLVVERREIEKYLKERKVSWCIDFTNEEDTYSRNKIRKHILPYAEQELVAGAGRHVAQAAMDMAELTDYVAVLREEAVKQCCTLKKEGSDQISIQLKEWRKLPGFMQKQVLLWAMQQAGEGRKDIGRIHIQGLLELADKEGYKRRDFPGGLEGIKEYDILRLRRRKEEGHKELLKPEQRLSIPGIFSLGEQEYLELSLMEKEKVGIIEENQYTKYMDYDKIYNYLTLRCRKQGDYLTINGAGQKKKLKEYMIQEKIAAPLRDHIPLVAEGNHILWVIGHRISAYYKVDEHTKTCVRMRIRKGGCPKGAEGEDTWKEYV
ncbi:MAG: tRNA lysidine(34) synthetase TilS [Lachnospiraceae bacterium]